MNSHLWLDLIILKVFPNKNDSMKKEKLRGEAVAPKQLKPFETQAMQSTNPHVDYLAHTSVLKKKDTGLYT